MTRTSNDEYIAGRLINGYDYENQAWVVDGRYVACGHQKWMDCGCYGFVHAGEETKAVIRCRYCEVTLPDLVDGKPWHEPICPPCADKAGHATFAV